MRKFLSLIFALFVTLPFCTKCYAIEVDSLGDEVRHVVRQSVPANIEILDGSIQSGAAGDLEYLDQKVVFLKSGVSDAGKNCVRLEVLFTGVPKTRIQSATFRLGTVNAGSLTYTISLFDWNSNSYIEHNSTGAISSKGLNEINLINWSDCHIDDSANIKVEVFGHHPFKINNNVTARHELLSATKDSNVIAFMNGHVHYYGNVVEDGVPINYITYIKDNPNQDFVTIEFSENYYYIYKRKATDHSKELWLSGRMNNTRKLRMTITNITARDNTVDVAVQIENAPDGVKSVQARIDNYGPYTQLIKKEGGIWSGSIDTGSYTPELIAGTHFVGVEAFDNEDKKWTEYKDYSTPSDNPTIKWVFETGDSIQSSATINEANVYVGSNDGNLYCIDRDTGSQKWCIQTGDFVISKPAITSEGKIVFGSGDEFVYCASADDGNIIWNTKLGGSVLSDPLTSEGRVFIGCGDRKIYCLNSASGEIVWEYQTDGLMRQRPILENGILYAFVRDTYIWYAIDASTGQLIWRGNANTDESLFVCGDVRPVIANGKLWCIDAQNTRPAYLSLDTGELAWTSTLEKVSSRGMTTNGSTVFYSSNSGRQITAFDAETNQVVWQKDLRYDNKDRDLQEMQIDSALVYNGNSLIHVAERGRITALNPDNGEILWSIDAAGYPERVFWATPEATDSLVIATGIDGKVYAVEYTH